MEFTDYMIWKAVVLGVLAFAWGLYRGFNGQPLGLEPHDKPTDERQE